ncbi:MAG: hypothetical protein ABI597_05920 [Gammaproteobacteria bacterium]
MFGFSFKAKAKEPAKEKRQFFTHDNVAFHRIELRSKFPESKSDSAVLSSRSYSKFTRENPPKRVVAFGLGGTLLDYEKSQEKNQLHLFLEEEIKEFLATVDKDTMVIILTSRSVANEGKRLNCLSVDRILDHFGKKYFDAVFFTNGEEEHNHKKVSNKYLVFDYLYQYYDKQPAKDHFVLIDDVNFHLRECVDHGFRAISSNTKEKSYFPELKEIIQETVTPSVGVTKTR